MKQNKILENEEKEQFNGQIASRESRLLNFVIDKIVFFLLIFLHAMVLDGWLNIIPDDGSPLLGLYSLILYVSYYTIFECLFKKTLGKFITNTIVVNENGKYPSNKEILIRNICRLIPFNHISFLVSEKGFHDQISKTKVVYDKK